MGYHTQLAEMSFDEIFDLTAGVFFFFYNIPGHIIRNRNTDSGWVSYFGEDAFYTLTSVYWFPNFLFSVEHHRSFILSLFLIES